jgi:uncharacterized protein (DUF1501 family)
MAITRRQFIKRSGLLTAGAYFGPSLFSNPFLREAFASTIGNRYFVVIFLNGGNDGFNTVVPYNNGGGTLRNDYENARNAGGGGLRLLPSDLDGTGIGTGGTLVGLDPNTGARLSLHPGFNGFPGLAAGAGGFKALYDAGELAVIQGCGYPNYSLSHDEARTIWQTANPLGVNGYTGTGWVGRHLAQYYTGSNVPGVCIEGSVAPEFRQFATSVLAIDRVRDFDFPTDGDYSSDDPAKKTCFKALYDFAKGGTDPLTLSYIGSSGRATIDSTAAYNALHSLYVNDANRAVFNDLYNDGGNGNGVNRGTATDLREVAKVINGVRQGVSNVTARYFEVSNGGYDTHSDQGAADPNGQHFQLHAEVGASLKVFRDDLTDMGVWDRTVVLIYSEFARRIHQNDNGTDHGSQGPVFVLGGSVRGGIYGNHPNVAESAWDDNGNTLYSQDNTNGFRSTDFRDAYGTVLKHWLNMPVVDIGAVVSTDTVPSGGDPNDYWTSADYDLKRPTDNADLFDPLAPT